MQVFCDRYETVDGTTVESFQRGSTGNSLHHEQGPHLVDDFSESGASAAIRIQIKNFHSNRSALSNFYVGRGPSPAASL